MGDIHEIIWRSTIFFIPTNKGQFSEAIILVEKQARYSAVPLLEDTTTPSNFNWSIVVVFLVLFGIEQALLFVRSLRNTEEYGQVPEYISSCNAIEEVSNDVEPEGDIRNKQSEIFPAAVDNTVLALLSDIDVGITKHAPQRSEEGTSGVYFMKNAHGRKVAVFKPWDEEGMNLEGGDGCELKPGCSFGEGSLKEVAAYLLDRDGFHGVPKTVLAKFAHSAFHNASGEPYQKEGSLQEFVSSEATAEEMGWKKFTTHDVHKVGILDCRILNLDRHLGNILVTEGDDGANHLVPIDHAFSFPSSISGEASFEWLQFPQCKQPFDKDTVNFICNIDEERDVNMLRQQLPRLGEECIETMKICTIFLKNAVSRGCNLYQIGCMMSRYLNEEEMSPLEKMYSRVEQRTTRSSSDFWGIVREEIDTTLTM